MDSREAWQLDGEDLKGEVLDLVRVRHELQSRMVLLIVEMFSRDVLGGKGFRAIAQWLHGSTNLEIGECSLLGRVGAVVDARTRGGRCVSSR